MTLQLNIPRNLWVTDDQANIELKGDITVRKMYGQSPDILGDIDSIRGFYRFYNKEFQIQKGHTQFQGLSEINPILDMQTLYSVRGIDIFITISGTKNSPIVSLHSDPPMQQNEIVSYLVFGEMLNMLQWIFGIVLVAGSAMAIVAEKNYTPAIT